VKGSAAPVGPGHCMMTTKHDHGSLDAARLASPMGLRGNRRGHHDATLQSRASNGQRALQISCLEFF
jgi:hypothetical protein